MRDFSQYLQTKEKSEFMIQGKPQGEKTVEQGKKRAVYDKNVGNIFMRLNIWKPQSKREIDKGMNVKGERKQKS